MTEPRSIIMAEHDNWKYWRGTIRFPLYCGTEFRPKDSINMPLITNAELWMDWDRHPQNEDFRLSFNLSGDAIEIVMTKPQLTELVALLSVQASEMK